MKVLGNRVLIKLVASSTITESGFILPHSNDNTTYFEGAVLQLGENITNVENDNIVYFTKKNIIKVDTRTYVVPLDNIFLIK